MRDRILEGRPPESFRGRMQDRRHIGRPSTTYADHTQFLSPPSAGWASCLPAISAPCVLRLAWLVGYWAMADRALLQVTLIQSATPAAIMGLVLAQLFDLDEHPRERGVADDERGGGGAGAAGPQDRGGAVGGAWKGGARDRSTSDHAQVNARRDRRDGRRAVGQRPGHPRRENGRAGMEPSALHPAPHCSLRSQRPLHTARATTRLRSLMEGPSARQQQRQGSSRSRRGRPERTVERQREWARSRPGRLPLGTGGSA